MGNLPHFPDLVTTSRITIRSAVGTKSVETCIVKINITLIMAMPLRAIVTVSLPVPLSGSWPLMDSPARVGSVAVVHVTLLLTSTEPITGTAGRGASASVHRYTHKYMHTRGWSSHSRLADCFYPNL